MPFVQSERTRERTSTSGTTTTLDLSGTVSTNQSTFDDGVGVGNSCFYGLVSGDAIGWELGIGSLTSSTHFSRDTVLKNHLGTTARISLSGESHVFTTLPGDMSLVFDQLFGDDEDDILVRGSSRWAAKTVGAVGKVLGVDPSGHVAYIDQTGGGGSSSWHTTADLATAAALPANTYSNGTSGVGATLTGNSNGALTVDGIACVVGYRILVKDESSAPHNGLYSVTQVGDGSHPYILTRSTDYDQSSDIAQSDIAAVGVAGSANGSTIWVSSIPSSFTLGTNNITWTKLKAVGLFDLSYAAGSPSNGDVLTYSTGSGKYSPAAPSGGSAVPTKSSSGFTTNHNIGSATVTDTSAGVLIAAPSNGVVENWRIVSKPMPATPFTAIFRLGILSSFVYTEHVNAGCGFFGGTDLNGIGIHIGGVNPSGPLGIASSYHYSNYGTSLVNTDIGGPYPNPIYFALSNDGTTLNWLISMDGTNFRGFKNAGVGSYTDIYFGVNPYASSAKVTLMEYRELPSALS